jgi:hypothetical protein
MPDSKRRAWCCRTITPLRIVLQEILIVIGAGWLENTDPTPAHLRPLPATLEKAVTLA